MGERDIVIHILAFADDGDDCRERLDWAVPGYAPRLYLPPGPMNARSKGAYIRRYRDGHLQEKIALAGMGLVGMAP